MWKVDERIFISEQVSPGEEKIVFSIKMNNTFYEIISTQYVKWCGYERVSFSEEKIVSSKSYFGRGIPLDVIESGLYDNILPDIEFYKKVILLYKKPHLRTLI